MTLKNECPIYWRAAKLGPSQEGKTATTKVTFIIIIFQLAYLMVSYQREVYSMRGMRQFMQNIIGIQLNDNNYEGGNNWIYLSITNTKC